MKADIDKHRKSEQELALGESGLEAARRDVKDGAMAPAYGPWRDDVVALLNSRRNLP